jgi:hypothetical protein
MKLPFERITWTAAMIYFWTFIPSLKCCCAGSVAVFRQGHETTVAARKAVDLSGWVHTIA